MTNTTNYNLKKPAYSDTADIADINSNMEIIDGQMKTNADGVSANKTSIENTEGGIAYRLGNTNTTGATLAVGTYVYVSGNSTLADGLYIVSTAIAANATLSSSNCTAVSGGGLNALNSKIANNHERDVIAGKIKVYRNNNVVYFDIYDGTYSNNNNGFITEDGTGNMINIPSGYRPAYEAKVVDLANNITLSVRTNGYIVGLATNKGFRVSPCWITNDAMPS